jgi:hypothetical protein
MLFSDVIHSDDSPRGHTEGDFAHLDRSSREECARIRQILESWVGQIPSDGQSEIVRRLKSGDKQNFDSAILELYTHQLLRRTGHTVILHPMLEFTSRNPDFLATSADGKDTIVECAIVTEKSEEELRQDSRLNDLFAAIDQLESADYFLAVEVDGAANSAIKVSRWRSKIDAWLATLDYEVLLECDPMKPPVFELEHDGLLVTVSPIPKKPHARGKPGRPIGVQSSGAEFVITHRFIRKRLKFKGQRYGAIDRPYVVVMNCTNDMADVEEPELALFGHDGVWLNPSRPMHKRVSAVLALVHLSPWTFATTTARLFHNPHAAYPYNGPLARLPQNWIDREVAGCHPRELLGLHQGWPMLDGE